MTIDMDIDALTASLLEDAAMLERQPDDFLTEAKHVRIAVDAISQLQAENAELLQAKRNVCSLLDRALEKNEALKEENKQLRADAERYRGVHAHEISGAGK